MANIIRIIIDSASGPFSSYSYADRLEVSAIAISYVKAIENGDNYEWNYNTNSKIFSKKFKLLSSMLEKYLKLEDSFIPDGISSFTIYGFYDDGEIVEKSFALTFEENDMFDLMFILKEMIPSNEDLPEYFFIDACENPLLKDEE